jgi:hypothetical protein
MTEIAMPEVLEPQFPERTANCTRPRRMTERKSGYEA